MINPFAGVPPGTVAGVNATEAIVGARTFKTDVRTTRSYLAVMFAGVRMETGRVMIGKVMLVCPAGTLMDAGTRATEELEFNSTTMPSFPAGEYRFTVPVAGSFPLTLAGARTTVEGPMGFTVRLAVVSTYPRDAVMVAVCGSDRYLDFIATVALL